jgi:SAM-dependent methyltransferase
MSDLSAAEERREERSRKIATHLRNGFAVSDFVFDDTFMPLTERRVSTLFWTPVNIALRVAELLVPRRSTRVLDIGSGVGKFCIVGAAATGARFVGVEHRQHLVHIATAAATEARLRTARFLHGDFGALDVRNFDSAYLYNPFEESCLPEAYQLDATIDLSATRFCTDVRRAEMLLAGARPGTRVATYHGFGGEMPSGYDHALRERHGAGYLDLWIKA